MNQKSIEHIALYSLVLVGTLVVGVLARQFVLSKGVDDFSSSVAFFATVIVLMAIYVSLQTTFNQFLLPRIEAFLLSFSAFQTMKNHNDTVSVPEAPTIKDSNQATPDVIESAPTAEETISGPSEYEVMRTNSIAKKNRAIQTKLENKSRKTKSDGREKRKAIFEAKTKCAQKSRLLPPSGQNTSVVQTPFESCLKDAFLLNFLLKYHLKTHCQFSKKSYLYIVVMLPLCIPSRPHS